MKKKRKKEEKKERSQFVLSKGILIIIMEYFHVETPQTENDNNDDHRHVEPISRSNDYVRSGIRIGSVLLVLYTPVSPSVPEMEGIYAAGGKPF